ncbi:hypothetical protein NDU88_005798 [Pleurodeles waltl]|uniref:Uncharacterized protein n=1 Tax=Pleurodeles waltl TaxID=8319 RepID=A0AAV7TBP4_PLEWA|nr:hypothetical protein NDU88_005798 [Pleurodeles waltl]
MGDYADDNDDNDILLIAEEGNNFIVDEVLNGSTTLDGNFYFDINEIHGSYFNNEVDFSIVFGTVLDEPVTI